MEITSLLHDEAKIVADACMRSAQLLRIATHVNDGFTVLDFGVNVSGSIQAGIELSRLCMGGLGQVSLTPAGPLINCPQVFVTTDHPLEACLLSQYAGWKIATSDYFGMASGPMRAIAATEDLFSKFSSTTPSSCAIGVLESGSLPTESARDVLGSALTGTNRIIIAVAPTASQAGNLQVVARSVETALHKLHELNFPVEKIVSATGVAPLPPVARNDLAGIGRTNDAILYGATVNLWVDCNDELIAEIGPQTPSSSSASHGEMFIKLFEAANHDFYALDPHLFSPAVVTFHNLRSGRTFEFGETVPSLLHQSFGD